MAVDTTETLKTIAEKSGMYIGTCANLQAIENDAAYVANITRHFNLVTPENALKFRVLCPERGEYNFEAVDKLVAFTAAHNMQFRGHVLVWNDQLPHWLLNGNFSRNELASILVNHIETVVGRYAGKIPVWDVVNESVDELGHFKKTFWYNTLGPAYIEMAFEAAHRADPAARLFYNDYGVEGTYEHENGVYRLLQSLTYHHIPVHGVGYQMHLSLEHTDRKIIGSLNTQRLADMGLECNITELDVRMRTGEGRFPQQYEAQAALYADIARNYILEKGCNTLILWGFTDRYSWIPFFYPGEGAATIMTEQYTPKPAFFSLLEELKKKI